MRYALVRLLSAIPTLVLASLLIFGLLRVIPGDAAVIQVLEGAPGNRAEFDRQLALRREELGLNQPLHVQYVKWAESLLKGDLGRSLWDNRPVNDTLRERLPTSIWLGFVTALLAVTWSFVLGIISALARGRMVDYVARIVGLLGISVPIFWSGSLAIFGLSTVFHWIPPIRYTSFQENPWINLQIIIIPALIQALYVGAPIMRLMRSQMLEVLGEDYLRTAHAKGLATRTVIMTHALRNSLLPVIAYGSWWIGRIMGGVVILEYIFSIPGMGGTLIQAVLHRDYTLVQGIVFVLVGAYIGFNLLVDLFSSVVDPRVRFA